MGMKPNMEDLLSDLNFSNKLYDLEISEDHLGRFHEYFGDDGERIHKVSIHQNIESTNFSLPVVQFYLTPDEEMEINKLERKKSNCGEYERLAVVITGGVIGYLYGNPFIGLGGMVVANYLHDRVRGDDIFKKKERLTETISQVYNKKSNLTGEESLHFLKEIYNFNSLQNI